MAIFCSGAGRRIISGCLAALLLLGATATRGADNPVAAAEPSMEFRWLQMDSKSADSLAVTIAAKRLSAGELTQRLDQGVTGGRMKNVASFKQQVVSGEHFRLPPGPQADDLDGTAKSTPPTVEGDLTIGTDGVVCLRYVAKRKFAVGHRSNSQMCISDIAFADSGWNVLQRWQDGQEAALLLVRVANLPKPRPNPHPYYVDPLTLISLDAEWRETARTNLAQLGKATPENSRKALEWLRPRSSLVGAAFVRNGSGRTFHRHLLQNDKADLDETKRPGLELEWQPTLVHEKETPGIRAGATYDEIIGIVDQVVSSRQLKIDLTSHYRSPKARGRAGLAEFSLAAKPLAFDVPLFVMPEPLPEGDAPVVVLVITPHLQIIHPPDEAP